MNKPDNIFRRVISLVLVLVLTFSFCPVSVGAQETAQSVPVVIRGETYFVDFKFVNDTLYCSADQWARAAACLWKHNEARKMVSFYDNYADSIAIYVQFGEQEYVADSSCCWVPFFETAKQCGVFFSEVKNDAIYGYRAKPLAEFYKDMDWMFSQKNYPISSLILGMGGWWTAASAAARSYAILSSMSVKGFIDAASGKMDQEIFDTVFVELLKTDQSLLGTVTDLGDAFSDPGEIVSLLQKSIDDDGVLVECLRELGFSNSDIQEITWKLAQNLYGDKTMNDLADFYDAMKYSDLLGMLKMIDAMSASIHADVGTVMAMQEVFSDSDSDYIRHAVNNAVGARLGSKALTVGHYTFEYLDGVVSDIVFEELEDSLAEGWDIKNWEKLLAKALVWTYDKALALTNKSDAIIHAEAFSLIQLELADYYYTHCDDGQEDTALMMHSVAMLYLRACLASWKMFEFDKSLSGSIDYAKSTLLAEIKNLMRYTETELLQNGTSAESEQAIIDLVRSMLTEAGSEATESQATEQPVIAPGADNSHLYGDAMAAYAELLQRGVMLAADNEVVLATHYQLLDMNGDKLPEMVAFAVNDYVSLFRIFAYHEDSLWWVGDSHNTCDISQWYNADHCLYICNGNRLFASAEKSTAGYTGGSSGILSYGGGSEVKFTPEGIGGLTVTEKLIEGSEIVGGIRIGSSSDPLAKTKTPTEPPVEAPTEAPYEEPSVYYDRPEDGTYYYSLAFLPCYDSGYFHVYLRGPLMDYVTFLNEEISSKGPIGFSLFHNAGYELYMVEDWHSFAGGENDIFEIYTYDLGDPSLQYYYYIEEGGFVSRSVNGSPTWTGCGLQMCQFYEQKLELADNCTFADESLTFSSERIEMGRDEFMELVNNLPGYVGVFTEVHVTVRNGKAVEIVLPYTP